MKKHRLTIVGAIFLTGGLSAALVSNWYLGKAFRSIAEKNVIADFQLGSPRNVAIVRNNAIADRCFWGGLAFSMVGIFLQTVAALIKNPE